MDSSNDIGARLQKLVAAAASGARNEGSFQILGGETKHFLGREPTGASLSVVDHRGIVNYQPKELVITARCGSRLAEIESTLAERDQMLSFEPPHFGPGATLGGAVATGLSGPRRPYAGSTRDFVMGVRILNGRGEMLRFGGEVMKNVAGYDVSRLMVGAMGTLGIILEASLKVMPAPAEEITLIREHTMAEAITLMNDWGGRPLPLSGACFHDGRLYARLSGAPGATRPARERLGGELLETTGGDHKGHAGDRGFWRDVREQRHDFFTGMTASEPLWRISVPPACPPLGLSGTWFIEWGGAQRWLRTGPPAREIRKAVSAMGGHVTLFRGGDRGSDVFHPLAPGIAELHGRIKRAFDPHGLFNPGRLYPNL
uniref:Glycolate oxidase FAD binding subunit n=1 Tax=Candidatus Kentrum sp. SD TaxID=2126332 RepID=A0A450Y524_9GAMM|nr:MAG: glycolate oxidase FAD binding subunit [Candidatus Kentron sp. SD]VFK39555.1 MAG: glycolate oxidase FAD binding subunit [Candidatus Kentron sp. SD]